MSSVNGDPVIPSSASLPSTVWQKYSPGDYDLPVDIKQNDRATTIKLWSFRKPHMRSFHAAWFGFFAAFLCWFSFAALMPEVKKSLHLTKNQVYNANIASVTSTVVSRFLVGPLSDTFGGRQTMSILLFLGAIPTAFSGLVNGASSLACTRFFIGFIGGTFVSVQCWMTEVFAKNVVGSANAIAAGWGNGGGGVTHLVMVYLWHGLSNIHDPTTAWRVSFLIPAAFTMLVAIMIWFIAEDTPKGNYTELVKHGSIKRKSSSKSLKHGARNVITWLLALQYACSFGMELTVFNNLASYFHDRFGITTVRAGEIAAIFGLLNFVTRPAGGVFSDLMNKWFGGGTAGMRGRLWAQWLCLVIEGIFLIIFARMDTLNKSIGVAVIVALGTEMANGTIYGIVPYVVPGYAGSVSGIVGAGGNVGAIAWGLMFRFGPKLPQDSWAILGYIVLICSCTVPLVALPGYASCLRKAKGEAAPLETY